MDKSNWRFCGTATNYAHLFALIDQIADQDQRIRKVRVSTEQIGLVPIPIGEYGYNVREPREREAMHDLLPRMLHDADYFEIYSRPDSAMGVVIEVVAESRQSSLA